MKTSLISLQRLAIVPLPAMVFLSPVSRGADIQLIIDAASTSEQQPLESHVKVQDAFAGSLIDHSPDDPPVIFENSTGFVSFGVAAGSAAATSQATDDQHIGNGGSADLRFKIDDTVTVITTPGGYGTLRAFVDVSCAAQGSPGSQVRAGWEVNVSVNSAAATSCSYGNFGTGQWLGDPVVSLSNDGSFTSGEPLDLLYQMNFTVSAASEASQPAASASASVILRRGHYEVFDENNQPVDFTILSSSGSARGMKIAAGGSYAGFTLTNNVDSTPDSHGTTAGILGGSASANTEVIGSFNGKAPETDVKLTSDGIDLVGTGSDPEVFELSYDPAAVQAQGLAETAMRLLWRDPATQKLVNAVSGDSGGTPKLVKRAYDAARDFHIGTFGVDVANHVVWAVIDHGGEFVVGEGSDGLLLKILSIARDGGTARLLCTGEPDAPNRIETSPDLSSASWTTLTSVTADADGAFGFDDTQASATEKFYRIAYP